MRLHASHGLLAAMLALQAGVTCAQLKDLDPDWAESAVPAAPQFDKSRILELEMPPYVSLKVGIDPATVAVTPEGVVRYVAVAVNRNGTQSATFEGIRCLTGEVRTYARFEASGRWAEVKDSTWQPLNGNQPSKHALAFSRQAACEGRAVGGGTNAGEIVYRLKYPPLRTP